MCLALSTHAHSHTVHTCTLTHCPHMHTHTESDQYVSACIRVCDGRAYVCAMGVHVHARMGACVHVYLRVHAWIIRYLSQVAAHPICSL